MLIMMSGTNVRMRNGRNRRELRGNLEPKGRLLIYEGQWAYLVNLVAALVQVLFSSGLCVSAIASVVRADQRLGANILHALRSFKIVQPQGIHRLKLRKLWWLAGLML